MSCDWAKIRSDFQILNREFYGKRLVYLDSAATSQKPRQVIEALTSYYNNSNANVHRSLYSLAAEATELYEGARLKLSQFLNAPSVEGVVFVRNTTEAINLVARSWSEANLKPGDLIVLTEMDHHSNIVPWQLAAKRHGATLHYVPFGDDGLLDLDNYRAALARGPKLVAFTHVSNALGTINPVQQMTEWAHQAGATVLVDGAQSAPHMPVDIKAIGCDFYAISGHKMLGPMGIGALIAKPEQLKKMPPFLGGGSMINRVEPEYSTWAEIPNKFEAGTPNCADVVALGAAIDYLQRIGMEQVQQHSQKLAQLAMEMLLAEGDIDLFGPGLGVDRGGLISFNFKHVHPHDVSQLLDSEAVAVRAGHHCCQLAMRKLDVAATVRASFYIYNNEEDIQALQHSLQAVRKVFGTYNG